MRAEGSRKNNFTFCGSVYSRRFCREIGKSYMDEPAALRGAARGILDDVTTSPASRRLASARPALASECEFIFAQTLRRRLIRGLA
jgi:hypothetical protein